MTSPAEKELGKIRKLRENMTCADCATQSQFGFTAVVMKVQGRQVGSFVCNHCKSAHQSFSHAVKSVTMSNWDMSEVHTLRARNGGGNDAVRATWLGGAPPGPGTRRRFTSTTTVFDRPWLKLCLTLPVSTVRLSPKG